MIQIEIKNGIVHTYSDQGKPIRMKGSNWVAKNGHAYEDENAKHRHEWEEVEDD